MILKKLSERTLKLRSLKKLRSKKCLFNLPKIEEMIDFRQSLFFFFSYLPWPKKLSSEEYCQHSTVYQDSCRSSGESCFCLSGGRYCVFCGRQSARLELKTGLKITEKYAKYSFGRYRRNWEYCRRYSKRVDEYRTFSQTPAWNFFFFWIICLTPAGKVTI